MAPRPPRYPPDPEALLTPEFRARLLGLRRLVFRRRSSGEQRGAGFGPAPEFDTHRGYQPGDDLRYLDWNLYARMEKLLVKMFVVEDQSEVCVLLDTSASMRCRGARKAVLAARFAAAFSFLLLAAGRPLLVAAYAGGLLGTRGPWRSAALLPDCLRFLAHPPEGSGTRFGAAAGELLAGRRGRTLLIVVSDFLQEEELRPEIAWVGLARHDLHLVQVLDDEELDPRAGGACTFRDAEGDGEVTLLAGEDFRADLRAALRDYHDGLAAACRAHAVPLARARTSQPFERTFLELLLPGAAR